MSINYYQPTDEMIRARHKGLAQFNTHNARALLAAWAVLGGVPQTYLDMGSGNGAMTAFARGLGVDAVGMDVTAVAPDIRADLRESVYIGESPGDTTIRLFDFVTSIEVAEHLEKEYADIFVANIARHMKEGSWLVFTAAIPGQQGDHHVNCQQPFYWREKFWAHQVNYDMGKTRELMFMWHLSSVTGPLMHLPANVQVFRKGMVKA